MFNRENKVLPLSGLSVYPSFLLTISIFPIWLVTVIPVVIATQSVSYLFSNQSEKKTKKDNSSTETTPLISS